MKQKITKSTRTTGTLSTSQIITAQGIGLFTASLVTVGMLLLFSIFVTIKGAPHKMFLYFSILAVSVGAFVGGIVVSKLMKEKGMAYGCILGCVFALLIYFISLIFSGLEYGIPLYLKMGSILGCSILGGILGVNYKRKRKI